MRSRRLLWVLGLLGLAALVGAVFDDELAARGIGPQAIGAVALLAAVAVGFWGRIEIRPSWILVWLLIFAALGLAYLYLPGVAEIISPTR